MTLRGCFVTGTDTGVGKTRVSAALLHWLGQRGVKAAGLKPVTAGIRHPRLRGNDARERVDDEDDDLTLLLQASSIPLQRSDVGPCQLLEPCAPTIAAALEGRCIDRFQINQAALALAARAEVLVIEGVGGFCVPLGADWDSADLACDFNLPVVLVVGLRLGGINHALLSAQAVMQRGLKLAGWVGNTLDPAMPHIKDNLATLTHELRRRHQAPCLGVMPWLERPTPATLAAHFNHAALESLFKERHS